MTWVEKIHFEVRYPVKIDRKPKTYKYCDFLQKIPPQRKVFSHKYTVDKIVDFICIISISDRIHSVLCKYLKPGQRILSTARCTLHTTCTTFFGHIHFIKIMASTYATGSSTINWTKLLLGLFHASYILFEGGFEILRREHLVFQWTKEGVASSLDATPYCS